MLKIRLARHGRKKLPFYRIVLTEHTKPAQSGYKIVLGWFNPLSHTMEVNVEEVRNWISKGAQPTERVAKLLFAQTKDDFFKTYFVERESTKGKEIEAKKKAESDAKTQEAKDKLEAAKHAAVKAAEEAKLSEEPVVEEVEEPVVEEVEEPVVEEVEEPVAEEVVEPVAEEVVKSPTEEAVSE